MSSPFREAPNGEGSYFDWDVYDRNGRWFNDQRVDEIRELDAKLITEEGTLRGEPWESMGRYWKDPDE